MDISQAREVINTTCMMQLISLTFTHIPTPLKTWKKNILWSKFCPYKQVP